jgi:hypothetical protein
MWEDWGNGARELHDAGSVLSRIITTGLRRVFDDF